jgi:hypothetical protein
MFQTQYLLTLGSSPSTGGTITGGSSGYFASGATVQLTATPPPGYAFAGWSGAVNSSTPMSSREGQLPVSCEQLERPQNFNRLTR